MARAYRPVDREQEFLLPPNMVDWLGEEHVVWFVIEAVRRLDTSAFHRQAKLGGVGRRGYDPDMLLTLFMYALAHGQASSRQMERLCHTDVAFRIICAQDVPDHTVLARFRQRHEAALTNLLTESLVLAAELGMVSLGVVAFDGTKIAANAARDANRSEAHLRKLAEEFVSTVAETDAAEDALFGEQDRGDELPPEVADRSSRRGRIDAALAQIAERRRAADRSRGERDERARSYERAARGSTPLTGRPPADADRVEITKARWQRERARVHARYQQKQTRRASGALPGPKPMPPDEHNSVRTAKAAYDAAVTAAAAVAEAAKPDTIGTGAGRFQANLTDPDSRLLKTRNGWIQGYNCHTASSLDELITIARATQDANDIDQFIPTMNAVVALAEHLAERTGRDELRDVGTLVGDAGFDSEANLTADGPDRLIADGTHHAVNTRATSDPATGDPPAHASAREAMNHRLRTPEGHALYQRRAPMIEAPNAWLKDGRGLRRFLRRGLEAVQSELSLAAATTNILKLRTKGITLAQLRTL